MNAGTGHGHSSGVDVQQVVEQFLMDFVACKYRRTGPDQTLRLNCSSTLMFDLEELNNLAMQEQLLW